MSLLFGRCLSLYLPLRYQDIAKNINSVLLLLYMLHWRPHTPPPSHPFTSRTRSVTRLSLYALESVSFLYHYNNIVVRTNILVVLFCCGFVDGSCGAVLLCCSCFCCFMLDGGGVVVLTWRTKADAGYWFFLPLLYIFADRQDWFSALLLLLTFSIRRIVCCCSNQHQSNWLTDQITSPPHPPSASTPSQNHNKLRFSVLCFSSWQHLQPFAREGAHNLSGRRPNNQSIYELRWQMAEKWTIIHILPFIHSVRHSRRTITRVDTSSHKRDDEDVPINR